MVGGDIFDNLTRGVPGLSPREMEPPASGFYSAEEVAGSQDLRYAPDKLFLGLIGADIAVDEKTGERFASGGQSIGIRDDRHVITIAGSRAGKGRSAIIPNMLKYEGSVLAVDPKGELAEITAEIRAKNQRVCVLDPFGTTDGKLRPELYSTFNPLFGLEYDPEKEPGKAVEDAVLITDALVIPAGNDPHWDESARTLIEGVILDVLTSERFEGRRDLVTVRDLIVQGEEDEDGDYDITVLGDFMKESAEPAVRRAAADIFDRPEREFGSVLSTVRRHLRALNFPEIEASLRGEGFNLSDLKTANMTVYLCLPGRHIGTCGRWLRLFVNLALQAMEKTEGVPAAGCPVLFVLDEFAALGHMREIEDAAGQIAGFGVKLWPILQDLGQLKALYKDRWETFMGNAGVLQFFGNNDLTTLEWISKRLGSTTIEQESGGQITPGAAEKGALAGYTPKTTAILEPDEIGLAFGRSDPNFRQLVMVAGLAPMILHRAFYDKHGTFENV